jgi:hypothetical protein
MKATHVNGLKIQYRQNKIQATRQLLKNTAYLCVCARARACVCVVYLEHRFPQNILTDKNPLYSRPIL